MAKWFDKPVFAESVFQNEMIRAVLSMEPDRHWYLTINSSPRMDKLSTDLPAAKREAIKLVRERLTRALAELPEE